MRAVMITFVRLGCSPFLGHLGFHCKIRLSALAFLFSPRPLHASTWDGRQREGAHFPLQPTARKPPPRKPCHHGAFVISLVPRRRRRVWMGGWHLAAASRICGQERLRRWERFIHGPPPRRPHFSLVGPITCCFVPSCMHTSNGFCGRQAFSAALRRRKPASEERVRDGEDFPSSTRRPTPTRTSQRRWCANADRRNLGHDVLKFWFCFWRHITCRVVEVFFSFERGRRWHGRMLPLILEESSISLEVNYHHSSVSHDVCLSLLFVASLGMYFLRRMPSNEPDTNGPPPVASHPLFRHRIFGNAFLPK